MKNKRLILILSSIVILLLIPFVAMQFTNEVSWSTMDFIIMGALLLGTGLAIELGLRNIKSTQNRLILIVIILVLFLLIWGELAVGIFGTLFEGS